jgi:hypothetical protein
MAVVLVMSIGEITRLLVLNCCCFLIFFFVFANFAKTLCREDYICLVIRNQGRSND